MKEVGTIKLEIASEHCAVIFDGTSRNGEAICAVARWCSSDFELRQRLVMFVTTEKHMDHKGLAALIRSLWLQTLGMEAENLSWLVRDSVKVNGSATTKLMHTFDNADDLM